MSNPNWRRQRSAVYQQQHKRKPWKARSSPSSLEMTPSERAADEQRRRAAIEAFKARGGRINDCNAQQPTEEAGKDTDEP